MTKKHTLFFNPKTIILHKLDLFLNAKCGNICVNLYVPGYGTTLKK